MKKQTTVIIILATALIAYFLCSCQQKRVTVEENLQEENVETFNENMEKYFNYLDSLINTWNESGKLDYAIPGITRLSIPTSTLVFFAVYEKFDMEIWIQKNQITRRDFDKDGNILNEERIFASDKLEIGVQLHRFSKDGKYGLVHITMDEFLSKVFIDYEKKISHTIELAKEHQINQRE